MDEYLKKQARNLIDTALLEDVANNDITTELTIPCAMVGKGPFMVKGSGVLAGIEIAGMVFTTVDPSLKFTVLTQDGDTLIYGDMVAVVEGNLASILRAERVALNLLQRLSGIATQTALYVDAVAGYKTDIYDTRKTTPGLRDLEKYAVKMGGGINHRRDLSDGILIKDNHLAAAAVAGKSLADVVRKAMAGAPPGVAVEVEVETVEQAKQALDTGADILLLDNMSVQKMRAVVNIAKGKAVLEASGGVTLDTVRAIAETGVDRISVGALTHSVKALDISLEIKV
ncbi:carboxylating nicotinate-nucleotide diphosphorylase [Chloroflexota bacterium]